MTLRNESVKIVAHFGFKLGIMDWEKSKQCAIYLCETLIKETLDVERIKYWKSIIKDIESYETTIENNKVKHEIEKL